MLKNRSIDMATPIEWTERAESLRMSALRLDNLADAMRLEAGRLRGVANGCEKEATRLEVLASTTDQ